MKTNTIKKIIAMALLVVIAVGMSACSSSQQTKLDQIKASGKLVVGTSADYPPYEFHKIIDGKDTYVGFDMAIAAKLAEELGVELEVIDMKFEGLLPALVGGKIDMIIAGMTPTDERKKSVDFSVVYYDSFQTMLVKKDNLSSLNTIEAFSGKIIGAQKSSIQEGVAAEKFTSSEIKSIGKIPDLIMELKTGKIDGLVLAQTVAEQYASANDDISLNNVDLGSEGGSAIAMNKGEKELVEAVDLVLNKLIEDGSIGVYVKEATELAQVE